MQSEGVEMKKILIRFDDMCPTMNSYQFERALELLAKYHVHALLGVIPDCKDPELQLEKADELFWEKMRALQKEGFVLAMHGFLHVYDSSIRGNVNPGYKSEFAGHSYARQLQKIREGKKILEDHGISTDVFFAPSHSYDNNTVKALAECGFKYMSDGYTLKAVKKYGVCCIPCRNTGCKKYGYYTAVFHPHEWAKKDKAYGFFELKNLLEKESKFVVDFYDYAKQPIGRYIWQSTIEKSVVFFNRHIRKYFSYVKHQIFKM